MNKEIFLRFNNNILQVNGYYSSSDRTTNKPMEFDISTIYYNGVNILPLLESMDCGFDLIQEIQDKCIASIDPI